MDKQLVEAIKAKTPAPFSFLSGVQTHMQKLEKGRFQDSPRKGMVIPKYDPFMDHVTSLIVNDYKVQVQLGIGRFLGKLNVNDFYGGCTRLHKDFDVMVGKGRGLSPNPFTTWAK